MARAALTWRCAGTILPVSSNEGGLFMRVSGVGIFVYTMLLGSSALAAPTISWQSAGVGGGGAMFSPSFSPHNGNTLFVSCDMSEVFRSTNLGVTWQTIPFVEIVGNRGSRVQFTSDPNIIYALDYSLDDLSDAVRPSRSTDGGTTWARVTDPTGEGGCITLLADPGTATRLLAADYSNIYFSNNSGTSWATKYTTAAGSGIVLAGAFWDGANIYVGTNEGLLVSSNSGSSFSNTGSSGIAAGQNIVSFCGAKEGPTTRFFALTGASGDVYGGVQPDDLFGTHQAVYSIDVGQPSWSARNTNLPSGTDNSMVFVACAQNDIDIAYVSGQQSDESPMVYKTVNGGNTWTSALNVVLNGNVKTGWAGHQGDRQWSYGAGTLGLAVAPNDPTHVAFTDLGFCHLSTDGGANWTQAYVNPADENLAGSATPKGKAYHSNGLEVTTNWALTWFNANNVWACFSDIQGTRSTDGGATWSFNYTGHNSNTSYDCVVHPTTGTAYLAASATHDVYETTHLTDSSLDGGTGLIRYSTNSGATWQTLHDFGHIVYDLQLDPNNSDRMYAAVIHNGASGGVWVTNNLSANAGSTWSLLAAPPRTQGHPYSIKVLNDGALVSTYCGRRTTSFTASSGVFISTNSGASWTDRSDANMTYYVKDLVIDPHDASQNTWYVGVWSGYGGPFATNNDAGGIYRTTNRGTSWTRIKQVHRVTSCAVSPTNANELYFTTEAEGLWYTANLSNASPTFEQLTSYPFGTPYRVYYDPFVSNKLWVTSFGHGTMSGSIGAPSSVTAWVALGE
ncbi:MAG: hypothetical protein ABI579_01815 [Candidatus Sumerlaeota bacterium]